MIKTKLLLLIIGLLISYPIYHYLSRDGDLVHKAIFYIVCGLPMYLILKELFRKIKELKSGLDNIPSINILFILYSFFVFPKLLGEGFERITYGSYTNKIKKIEQSNSIVIGKVINIDHTMAFTIKRKNVPDMWLITYTFNYNDEEYNGSQRTKKKPIWKLNDTISIKLVKEDPNIHFIKVLQKKTTKQ